MFLPLRMRKRLRGIRLDSSRGEAAPLVPREDTLYLASRPPVPTRPPDRSLVFLLASTLLGVSTAGFGWLTGRRSVPAQ